MTIFRDRTHKEISKSKWDRKDSDLIQQNWCLYTKRHQTAGSLSPSLPFALSLSLSECLSPFLPVSLSLFLCHAQKKGHVRTKHCLQSRKTTFPRNWILLETSAWTFQPSAVWEDNFLFVYEQNTNLYFSMAARVCKYNIREAVAG